MAEGINLRVSILFKPSVVCAKCVEDPALIPF
jgi:hypothetical protein